MTTADTSAAARRRLRLDEAERARQARAERLSPADQQLVDDVAALLGMARTETTEDAEEQPSLAIVPVSFDDACQFVAAWHRHHAPPVGHKFSVGVADGTTLVGVAIVGRPVARHLDNGSTLEVTRAATDGTPHVNSMLYAACWRAAKALGYRRLVTYTQSDESGASLRAAGWTVVAERRPRRGWDTPSRPRQLRGTENVQRYLWEAQP